ncbi:TPA: hypothetical protein ACKP9S_003643 [Pseudomonas aeruginosa]
MKNRSLMALLLLALTAQQAQSEEELEDCSKYQQQPSPYGGAQALSVEFLQCARRNEVRRNKQQADVQAQQAEIQAKRAYELSPSHSAMSYQRCVLDKVPDAQNDMAAQSVANDCGRYQRYARQPEADFIGFDTARECYADLGGKTPSRIGSIIIARACQDLYPGSALSQ